MKETADFILLILIYFVIFYKRWKSSGKDVFLVKTTLYIYLSFVLYYTLMPIIAFLPTTLFNLRFRPMNWIPFIDVSLGRGDFIRQIILNVIMTVPFGFLFPLTKKGNEKWPSVLLATFLLSLSIEILQSVLGNGVRTADITDIITNVSGGILGYMIYLIFKPFTTKIINYLKTI